MLGPFLALFPSHVIQDRLHDHVVQAPIALLAQLVQTLQGLFFVLPLGHIDRDPRVILIRLFLSYRTPPSIQNDMLV